MSWDSVILAVRKQIPQFNNYLLIDYRKEQIASAARYMGEIFQHAIKPLRNNVPIEYLGYHVASPEETIYNMLNANAHVKNTINIQNTEAVLVNYEFKYLDTSFTIPIYIPYLMNNMLVTGNINYMLQHLIVQREVVRINSGRGIMTKVMQIPIRFFRNEPMVYTDTNGREYSDSLITTKIYLKRSEKTKKDKIPTVVLYLLANFGFSEAMRRMNAEDYILGFVDHVPEQDDVHVYFQLTPHIFLKCSKDATETQDYRRIILSIIYIWQNYQSETNFKYAYEQSQYKMILGSCIQSEQKTALLESHGQSHLESMQDYLDDVTKDKLYRELGYEFNDIYDLLVYLFFNIDSFLTNYRPNDLFDKRLRGIDALFDEVTKTIFKKYVYRIKKNTKKRDSKISNALRIPSNIVMNNIYTVEGASCKTTFNNDNALFSVLIKKLRPDQSKEQGSKGKTKGSGVKVSKSSKSNANLKDSEEHNLHPSFAAVESILALPSGNPCVGGDINPFLVINDKGMPQKNLMPWYEEIEDFVDEI